MPTLTVIAGQNGAGKSTLVKAHRINTIDPDEMAQELGQGYSDAANIGGARAALKAQRTALKEGRSFGVETTLAGKQPLELMDKAKEQGYDVRLAFVVPHPDDDTVLRIQNRVMQGGHNISEADIERRAPKVLENLPEAMKRADVTAIYVSSEKQRDFVMVGAMHQGQVTVTPQMPEQVRAVIEREFSQVQQTESISRAHPVARKFQPHIQQQMGY